VLSPGGTPLALNSVFLTADTSIPIGTVQAFASAAAVAAWFGSQAPETLLANIYFSGTDISTQIPAVLYFAQFNGAAVAGYLRGASVAAKTLTQIQGLAGTITLTIDGVSTVSEAINLSAASSFSNAAALIQTALQGGTPNNTATVTYDALRAAFVVTSPTTGASSSIGFPTVDSLTTGLNLTAAAGAVQSAGAVTAVPATLMATIAGAQQNWAVFMTVAEQILTVKEAFAAWVQTTNKRYAYACQDSDASPTTNPNATGSFGNIVAAAEMDGIEVIYDNGLFNTVPGAIAAFFCAYAASINLTATNGNTTAAFRGQAGLVPQVTDITTYTNLKANGYNAYCSFATSTQQFQEYQPGSISGEFLWANAYLNQIYLNSQLQQAGMNLLKQIPALPYAQRGKALIRSAFSDPINAGLNFGSIVAGVNLSAAQIAEVNNAAGVNIATTLQQTGWYLQILDAQPNVRTARGSPPMTFWYTDGGSIQSLDLASIDVQ
jgi:hypothetical protein